MAIVTTTDIQILTNKTIDGSKNTLLNIPASALPAFILSSIYFSGTGSVASPIIPKIDLIPVNGSVLPISSNAVFNGLASKVSLNSPAFLGVPTAPTAAIGTNTTQIATTAFVKANSVAVAGGSYFTLSNGHTAIIPDNDVYYFGANYTEAPSNIPGRRQFVIPMNCTLVGWSVVVNAGDRNPTAEKSVISVRINNTTDVILSSAVGFNSAPNTPNVYYAMNLLTNLVAGSKLETKWSAPIWAVRPGNSSVFVTYYFKF